MIETSPPLRIILIQNNENERLLFRRAFQKSDIPCDITECANAEQVPERLGSEAPPFDVVVVDQNLPGISGMDLCRKLLDDKIPSPVVFVVEMGSERLAAEALRLGVHDCIIKDPHGGYTELLPVSLINTANRYNLYNTGKRTEQELRNRIPTMEAILDAIPDSVLLVDAEGNFLDINKSGAERLGKSRDEIIGTNARDIFPADVYESRRTKRMEVVRTGKILSFEDERDGINFETWACPVFDAKGKVKSIAIFSHDITSHKKTEKELRQSEEKFRLAMEVTNDALWDWNMVTNEVYRNPRHATMLGYEPQELTTSQDEWEKRIHPDDRQNLFKVIDEHCSGKIDLIETEYRLRCKSGDYVWVLGRGKIVKYNDDGSPARMIGTNINITDRKNLIARNEIILKTCIDGFWLIDLRGQILEVNDAYCRMSGYSREELLNMKVQDVEAAESPQETLKHISDVMEKRYDHFESRQKCKDGTIIDLDISATYLKIDGGRVFTFFRDITANKKADREIRKFKTIADNAGYGVAISDLEGNLIYVNDSFANMHQYSADELIGKNLTIFHNEKQLESVNSLIDQLKQQSSIVAVELWHKKRDNTVFPTLMSAALIKDEAGRPIFMASTTIDITEHKKANEALRESEKRLKYLVSSSPAVIYTCETSGNYNPTYVSENVVSYTGYEAREFTENPSFWIEHVHPDDKKNIFDALSTLFEKGQLHYEYRFVHKDGSYRWTIDELKLIRDEQGNPLEIIGSWMDITDRKKAEEAMQESENRYRTLFDILPVGVGRSTFDGRILDTNSAFQQMLGYSTEEIMRISVLDTYYNPEERAPYLKQLQQDGFVRDFEVRLKRKDGTILIANLNVTTASVHGETVLVTVANDITEQKKMKKALVESEEKYRTLVECAKDLIFTVDKRGIFVFTNKIGAETLGYQPEGLIGKTLWDIFPKKIAERQMVNIRKVIDTEQGMNSISVTEIQNKPRWYSAIIEPMRDDHGKVTTALIIARDIDDSKRAEEQIQKLSSAVESSINGIVIGNINGNLTYANSSFIKMWGYEDQSEILGRNAVEFWKVNDKEQEIAKAMQSGNGWIGELTAVKKDGSLFDIQVCQTSIKDENNKIISLMASFIDITESKRREEELSKYRSQMARAEQLASLGTLSATVAHQVTQPLTVIRLSMDNALDELEATSSSQTVIRRLKDSVAQVSNITSIIERFRNFARKSSGRTATEINLKAVALRIVRLLNETARSANIVLRVKDMGDLPCPWMNETDLEQLLFALIENSIQAANDEKKRNLLITGTAKERHIELCVSDDCGGIAPENLDKIFEPFFTTKPRGLGTGLGLCIVKDVVSRIGGHVRVESKYGKGTTFTIIMPFQKDNKMDE